jgi:hypothetical protein
MVASKKIYDHTPEADTNTNHGHSLLSFMNLASNKVKTALEKPNTFKRNINHRRFLQKQFRAMVKSPEKSPGRRTIARGNIDPMNFNIREYNSAQTFPPPLSHNFVQFDALDTAMPNLGYEAPSYCDSFDRGEGYNADHSAQKQMQCAAFERGHMRKEMNSSCLYQNDCSSSIPDLGVEEDFLTGEELTQAIELKDLFIPETDLTQYLMSGKENVGGFCNSHASVESTLCRDFGLQEDILVF